MGAIGVWFLISAGLLITPTPPLADILPGGVLRIGIDASNPPFAVATENTYTGFEIDLANLIVEALDIPMRFVGLGFDGLYDALAADQVDMVIAGLTIDSARLGSVRYSRPYFNTGLVLITSERPINIQDAAGKRIAFELGSMAQISVNEWLRRIHPFMPIGLESPEAALEAVRLGNADAALADAVSTRLYLRTHAEWDAQFTQVTDTLLAIATRVDRPLIGNQIDKVLERLFVEGVIAELLQKWF